MNIITHQEVLGRFAARRHGDRRGAHHVKLSDLRVALQHLHRLLIVGDLKLRTTTPRRVSQWQWDGREDGEKGSAAHRIGRDDPHAAVRARLEALHASIKRGRRVGPALIVQQLLLRRKRHVEKELGRNAHEVGGDAVALLRAQGQKRVRRAHEYWAWSRESM